MSILGLAILMPMASPHHPMFHVSRTHYCQPSNATLSTRRPSLPSSAGRSLQRPITRVLGVHPDAGLELEGGLSTTGLSDAMGVERDANAGEISARAFRPYKGLISAYALVLPDALHDD